MSSSSRIARIALAFMAFAFANAATAQTYPSKPIRVIVPFAAGGTSDILARFIGPKLTEAWGQPVIIENRTGANGNVGADYVAKPQTVDAKGAVEAKAVHGGAVGAVGGAI